ncbi:phage tail assembly chaperone, partial [Hungatella hathewayi]|uniref:phage tail assembly chaperone n=1 Tax=Hungatella hathewayi TaxID=154046 RepID=UPI0022E07680
MGSLNAFLHPEQAENKEVIVSERFKENGKPVPFVIRPVEPDLENSELQRAYGTLGADKTLVAMLYVGEFATLMEAVQGLSGLDKDINEDI